MGLVDTGQPSRSIENRDWHTFTPRKRASPHHLDRLHMLHGGSSCFVAIYGWSGSLWAHSSLTFQVGGLAVPVDYEPAQECLRSLVLLKCSMGVL